MINVKKNLYLSLLLALFGGVLALSPRLAIAVPPVPLTPTMGYAERMDLSPALRDVPPLITGTPSRSAPEVNLRLPKVFQSDVLLEADPAIQLSLIHI